MSPKCNLSESKSVSEKCNLSESKSLSDYKEDSTYLFNTIMGTILNWFCHVQVYLLYTFIFFLTCESPHLIIESAHLKGWKSMAYVSLVRNLQDSSQSFITNRLQFLRERPSIQVLKWLGESSTWIQTDILEFKPHSWIRSLKQASWRKLRKQTTDFRHYCESNPKQFTHRSYKSRNCPW